MNVLQVLGEFEYKCHPYTPVQLYYEEGLTQTETDEGPGCGQRPISRWMRRYGIEPGRGQPEWARNSVEGGGVRSRWGGYTPNGGEK